MKYIAIVLPFIIAACGDPHSPAKDLAAIVADTIPMVITEGHQVLFTKDGGKLEGELHDGKRVGAWASYFPNGGIRSRITYVDGREEGPTEVFHETGMTYYTGAYHKGLSVGEWIFYNPQGEEQKRVRYDSLGVMLKD